MQRAQAMLLVLALFAAPLALLARASSGMGSECGNLCCLPHGSHSSAHVHDARSASKAEAMACHHKDSSQAAFCTMKAGHHPSDFGFLAPLVPTVPSAYVNLVLPLPARSAIEQSVDSLRVGFMVMPFEPPRS
jgi:hypothetical protein